MFKSIALGINLISVYYLFHLSRDLLGRAMLGIDRNSKTYAFRKRKIELKVKSSKLAKEHTSRALRPAASIFQESEYIKDEENCTEMQNKTCKKTDSNDERYHPEENFSPSDGYNDENSAHNIHSPRQQKVYKQEKQSASKDNKSFGDNTGKLSKR